MKTVMLSRFKIARSVMLAGLVISGSISILITGTFSTTASAADPSATDCYALDGASYNTNIVAGPLNPNREKQTSCINLGYCKEVKSGNLAGITRCSEEIYKASDQYKATLEAADNDAILNAQVSPIIDLVCGKPSTNTQADQEYADCAGKVKTQYKVCQDAALNHSDNVADSISSCMLSWAKDTYPAKKIKAQDMTDAVNSGIGSGTEKSEEIDNNKRAAAEKVCTDKGLTYSPDADGADADGCVGASTTCTGGSLGWILCPLTNMMSSMIASLTDLIDGLLTYEPLLITTNGATPTQGQVLQSIWSVVVRIANILLVIAFMVVIFSQATSIGLSAYGIKKMLPRIIAAAILINLSFFICAIAVDITNIAGASIQGIIQSAIGLLPNSDATVIAAESWNIQFVLLTGTLVAASAVTGAIFYIFPFLLTAALTLLTAFILLAARQIVITLLIIVAPLAFAAFVLPNTESLFKKWQKLFTVLLLMYPLIMTIFYGSNFMSQLILATKANKSSTNEFFTDIIAFAMLFVPLFILPTLMKLAGGILERIGGIINDREKGFIDGARKKAGEWQGHTAYQQGKTWRKKADEDYKAANLAKRLQGKGAFSPYDIYSQIAARGASGNLGRIPVVKNTPVFGGSWRAQDEVVNRAARGRVATAANEEVKAEMARLAASEDGRSITSIRDYVTKNASSLSEMQMRAAGELLLSKPGAKGSFRKLIEDGSIMQHNAADGLIDAGLSSEGFRAAHPDISNALEKADLVGAAGDVATGKIKSYTGANFVAGNGGKNSKGIDMVEDSFNWEKVARRADSVLKVSENNADFIKGHITQETAIAARDSGEAFVGADPDIKSLINHIANGNPGSTWVRP